MQVALLECFDQTADVDEAKRRLDADERLTPFRDWVDAFDPRALALCRVLVDRWGERPHPAPEGQMRAAVLESTSLLRFRAAPIPAPNPGQVRLRIEASGLCGTDVHLWRGLYGAPLPLVLGHEGVGIVDAVGPGVERPRLGDRVGVPWMQGSCGACVECRAGRRRFCVSPANWMVNGGANADYALAEAEACVAIPEGLSPIVAAPLFCAGHTAFAALDAGGAKPGSRVAIIGMGGLGHLAVQLASQRGCQVFAVTSDPTKLGEMKRWGAHTATASDDAVSELARAGGVDVIVSTTTDPSAAGRLVPALRPEGKLALAGLGENPLTVDAAALVQRGVSIVPVVPGGTAQLRAVLGMAAEGRITPVIERYPFEQLRRALYRLADSRVRYRAVIDVGRSQG